MGGGFFTTPAAKELGALSIYVYLLAIPIY